MDLHTLARLAGLVGGLCWAARFVMDLGGSGTGMVGDGLYVLGLLLLVVALVAAGAGLVSTSATWLRVIVAVAFPLLVWSVLQVLHEGGNAQVIDGVFGLAVAGISVVQLVRSKPKRQPPSRRRAGAHAR